MSVQSLLSIATINIATLLVCEPEFEILTLANENSAKV